MKPGKSFSYTLDRNGRERDVRLTLIEMPEEAVVRVIGKHMLHDHAAIEVASND